jgi:hypothetical protein
MKIVPAIIAAFFITALVAAGMLIIGGNALINQNTIPLDNSPQTNTIETSSTQDQTSHTAVTDQQKIQQLHNLVQQYQAREKQYQTQLNDAAQRINQENQQMESYQQLLTALQRQGIIRITNDGQVLIPRRGGNNFSDGDN